MATSRGRGGDPPQERQRGPGEIGAGPTIDDAGHPVGRGGVIDDQDRRARGARARLAQSVARHVAGAQPHDDRVRAALLARGARRLCQLRIVAEHDDRRVAPGLPREGVQHRGQLGIGGCQLVADAREGVQHQETARPRPPEARQSLDVGAQQRVDLREGPGKDRRDLARESLSAALRIAVADEHEIGERPQLPRRGQGIAPRASGGRRLQAIRGKVEDGEVERLVGQARQAFGHRLDVEHEAFAGQRTRDARPLGAVFQRHEEAFLGAAGGVAEYLQRPARAIGFCHRAASLYQNEKPAYGALTVFASAA